MPLKPDRKSGFTIVEILIIAPVVILVIGAFISVIVSMTGDVLSTRGSNNLAYNIQDALNRIDQDVKTSGGFLATNNITLTTPQGYNDDVTNFDNVDATSGTKLILNVPATTSSPLAASPNLVYENNPNPCGSSQVNSNNPVMLNVVYFVKNNTLWRRILAPANYKTIGCSIPWQQPSCSPALVVVPAFCATKDIRLVDGVNPSTGFVVDYYTDPSSTTASNNVSATDSVRQTALQTTNTINVTITATNTIAGRDVTQSGVIRSVSPNNNITATGNQKIKVLVVAGGGSGSTTIWGGGGGGGGGVLYHQGLAVAPGAYTVTVGAGGAASAGSGNTGGDSFFGALRAYGGGGGYQGTGGSGGGDGHSGSTGLFGASNQINNNGGIGYGNIGGYSTYVSPYPDGGGGGAGGPGGNGIGSTTGAGGPGQAFNITGSTVYYAGGGGSSDINSTKSPGGIGGGGGGGGALLFSDATERTSSPSEYTALGITAVAAANLGKTITLYADLKSAINGNVTFYALGKYEVGGSTVWASTPVYQRIKMNGTFSYNAGGANGEVCNLSFYGVYGSGVIPTFRNVKIELGGVDATNGLGGGGGGGTGDKSGAGGSGVVIVSYPTGSMSATGGTITTSGGNTIHKFTSNGTFTVL